MIKRWCGALAFLGASASAAAAPPKLLIVIAVDQFSAQLFNEYRPQFTGGLARLASGTVFRNGYQSHAATETCPGHSTILTGVRPSRNGIIANEWTDQGAARADKSVYCAEDESVAGSTSRQYTVSAKHLLVPTLGDYLRKVSPQSRVVAVSGKDRAGVMMGGLAPDQRWYWRRQGFTTDLTGAKPPLTVAALNKAVAESIAKPLPALEPPPVCAAKAKPTTIGGGKVVGAGAFARAAGDAGAFEDSPEFDGAVLALAAGIVGEMKLGQGPATDVLTLGLSATDYVGHTFGTSGQEMCLQMLSLDRDLGDYFQMLDASKIDYAVALTADHGSLDIPDNVPGGQWVDDALDAEAVGKTLATQLKLAGPVLFGGHFSDIFVDRSLSPADRARAQAAAITFYRAHPQVEAVFARSEIEAVPVPTSSPDRWSIIERVRASYNPLRSGDFYVVLKAKVAPYSRSLGIASTHGSVWDYDRQVPLIFYRPGWKGATIDRAVETVDVMPTVAAEIGLALPPGAVDGKCLAEVTGIACPTP